MQDQIDRDAELAARLQAEEDDVAPAQPAVKAAAPRRVPAVSPVRTSVKASQDITAFGRCFREALGRCQDHHHITEHHQSS